MIWRILEAKFVCSETFQNFYYPFQLLLNISRFAIFEIVRTEEFHKSQMWRQMTATIYKKLKEENFKMCPY